MQSTISETRMADSQEQRSMPPVRCLEVATLAFIVMASVMMATAIYTAFNLSAVVSYTRDIWHHLAVYSELIASPFHAMNPHVATDDPSRSYSPWTVIMALLARAGGLDATGAIAISAILSTFIILLGIFLFSREYLRNAWAPALFLLIFFGSWGQVVNHTGFHTVATFMYSASYPFAIVLGMGFILWWMVLKSLNATPLQVAFFIVIFIPISASLFITHQLQGLFAVGATIAFALFAGKASLLRRLILAGSLLVGLFVSQYWWYFDPIAYVLNPEVRGGHSAPRMFGYSTENISVVFVTLGAALLGVAGLFNKHTGRVRLELALPLLVIVLAFTFLLVNGNWVSTRFLPFIALFLQIGLVTYLLQRSAVPGRLSNALNGAIIGALLVGFGFNALKGYENYQKSRIFIETGQIEIQYATWNRSILAASEFAETLVPAGATVIAHRDVAFPMEATSLAVVAIPRLFALVPDMFERQSSNNAFFDDATSRQTRCSILAQYDVQMIVYRPFWLSDAVETQLQAFGTAQVYGDLTFIPAETGHFSACPS